MSNYIHYLKTNLNTIEFIIIYTLDACLKCIEITYKKKIV